ncbi:MAG: class I SAM-dependent methyltransferase [bacterium]|nr:class I SAM-dependent methyltransferase [bacterium]
MECLCCGRENVNFYKKLNGYINYRCSNCGLIFVWPKQGVGSTDAIYAEDYFRGASRGFGFADYEVDKKVTRKTFDFFLGELAKIMPEKGSILDIGCATGYFMELAENEGWHASGIDISEYAVKKGREKQLNTFRGTLSDNLFKPGTFNAISLFDVLEHLPEPLEAISKAKHLLKNRGIVIVNTPDSSSLVSKVFGRRWHLINPPEHLYLFNKNNLSRFFNENGFKILKIGKIGKTFTLKYVLRFLANRRIPPFGLFNRMVKNEFLGKLPIPINLRDNFFIIAQKND